jgi:small subunit ribosomal protein S8
MTDPIADMLTRIRNALARGKTEVSIPFSKIKFAIAKILEKNGWITKVENIQLKGRIMRKIVGKVKSQHQIRIILKYEANTPLIRSLRRISKSGRRVYVSKEEIPRVMSGQGMTIISTSQGLMVGREARRKGLGGELLCEIY